MRLASARMSCQDKSKERCKERESKCTWPGLLKVIVVYPPAFEPPLTSTVNPIKLETGLRPNGAGIPYTLPLRIEAMRLPTFGLLPYDCRSLSGLLKKPRWCTWMCGSDEV